MKSEGAVSTGGQAANPGYNLKIKNYELRMGNWIGCYFLDETWYPDALMAGKTIL